MVQGMEGWLLSGRKMRNIRRPQGRVIIDRPDQPSGNSGELVSSQGFLDNSPQPYGLSRAEPLQARDKCGLVIEVLDPGNEYTFARARVFGNGDIGGEFFIRPDALQRCFLWRERD